MPVFQQSAYVLELIDIAIESQLPVYQREVSSLKGLEAQFGLFQLKQVMQSSRNCQQVTALKNFLKHRWSYIKNTDMQYNQDFISPLNQVCIKISKILNSLTGIPSLALLMPSLKQVSVENYITSSYSDEELDLRKVVLSDDTTRIIYIEDVLDFAILDGRLKHHAMIGGKANELSTAEIHRVLTRDESVHLVFNAISDKVQQELHGETAGAYLKRLINGLTLGNVDHHGQEVEAGEDAHIAIAEFEEFLNILDEETRKKIMGFSALYESFSGTRATIYRIQDCWQRLCHQVSHPANLGTYCVKIIGSELENILDSNPELYQLTAFHDEDLVNLDTLIERIEDCKELMKEAFQKPFKQCASYGESVEQKVLEHLAEKIQKNTEFQLNAQSIALIATSLYEQLGQGNIKFIDNCQKILLHVHQHYSRYTISQAMKKMPEPVKDLFMLQTPQRQTQAQSLFVPNKRICLEKNRKSPELSA